MPYIVTRIQKLSTETGSVFMSACLTANFLTVSSREARHVATHEEGTTIAKWM